METVEARRKKWPIILAGPKTLTYRVKESSEAAAASRATIVMRNTIGSKDSRFHSTRPSAARKIRAMMYSLAILKVVNPEPSMKQEGNQPEKIAKHRAPVMSPKAACTFPAWRDRLRKKGATRKERLAT